MPWHIEPDVIWRRIQGHHGANVWCVRIASPAVHRRSKITRHRIECRPTQNSRSCRADNTFMTNKTQCRFARLSLSFRIATKCILHPRLKGPILDTTNCRGCLGSAKCPLSQTLFAQFPKRCQLSAQPEIRFLPNRFRKHFAKCRQCSTRPLANRAWTLSAKCPISTQPNMPQLTNGLWIRVARCAILNATQYVAMRIQIADTFRNLSKPRHLPR